MTRQQVATRLGKSLATVRRLEGVRLRPVQDARGVHRFDPDEVEALARYLASGQVALWQELRPNSGDSTGARRSADCPNCSDLEQQVQALQQHLEELRAKHHRELDELHRARAQHDRDAEELAEQLAELLASLEA